jgi:hypothetical protein
MTTQADMTLQLSPLTERIFEHLPTPRWLWIGIWAIVPWINAGANLLLGDERSSAVWEQGRVLVILNYATLSLAMVITLSGAARIARRLESLRAPTAEVLEREAEEPFRGMNSVAGPLLASGATALLFAASALARDGWASAVLRGTTWFVLGIAIWTFLWTYASLQLGLGRLGREHLRPDVPRADPGLGLRPLGGVAFMGLWMLMMWLVPVLLTGLPDLVGVIVGSLVLLGALAAFFLSLVGLHRQMIAVKSHELELARDLYAQAYEPVRVEPTLETLEQQRSLLGAADALEKRAHAIHDWPIDEGTFARVLTITTSVVAMIVARLILEPLGL